MKKTDILRKIKNRIAKYTFRLVHCAFLFILASCVEDLQIDNSLNQNGESTLTVKIPKLDSNNSYFATRASGQTAPVSTEEGTINSLNLYLFKNDGSLAYHFDLKDATVTSEFYEKTVTVAKGSYQPFITANIESYLSDELKTEEELTTDGLTKTKLENILLNFNSTSPLQAGNLPLACLNSEITGDNNGNVNISEGSNTTITSPLTFLCSKVRYTVLFNSDGNSNEEGSGFSSAFGNKTFEVVLDGDNGPYTTNLRNTTTLLYKESQDENPTFITSGDEGNEDKANWPVNLSKASYPESGANYPEYKDNQPDLNLTPKDAWEDKETQKRAWQGVIYLPENRSTTRTTLNLNAEIEGNSSLTRHSVELVGSDGNKNGLIRGYMYDVVTKVTSYSSTDWETAVTVSDWQESLLPIDMVHTYLTLEKTEFNVTSEEPAVIGFSTDGRGNLKNNFICNNPDELIWASGGKIDKPVIIITDFDEVNHTLTFSANPEIDITRVDSDATEGTAICYVVAGNIKKQVKINYNLTPYFEITPSIQKIRWDSGNSGELTKVFEYTTNLGGIILKSLDGNTTYIDSSNSNSVSTVSNSSITITCNDASAGSGEIRVTATSDPGESTSHYFIAYPANKPSDKTFEEHIEVQVMPPYGDYFIYFRAINDYQSNTTDKSEFLNGNYSYWPDENNINSRWTDWWASDDNSGSDGSEWHHFVYVYGQNGETLSANESTDSWDFSGSYLSRGDDTKMIPSSSKAGWYKYTLDNTKIANGHPIEPGKTLVIFYAGRNSEGVEIHRAPHHMDPGVTLFDYEDREGYIVYDPTREPYTSIYDDVPTIKDVTYTVYSIQPMTRWWNFYGNKDKDKTSYDNPDQFEIYYEIKSSDFTKDGEWYKTSIKLKVANNDYEKAILLGGIHPNYIPQRVYLEVTNDKDSWGTPRVYIYNTAQDEHTGWYYTPEMSYYPKGNGKNIYYYDVPSGFENGYVIFQSNDRSKQSRNDAGNKLDGKSRITQTGDTNYWEEYYPEGDGTDPGVRLFDGKSFPNQTGYYKNGKWSATRPN